MISLHASASSSSESLHKTKGALAVRAASHHRPSAAGHSSVLEHDAAEKGREWSTARVTKGGSVQAHSDAMPLWPLRRSASGHSDHSLDVDSFAYGLEIALLGSAAREERQARHGSALDDGAGCDAKGGSWRRSDRREDQ